MTMLGLVVLGVPDFPLAQRRRADLRLQGAISGSLIGDLRETQEMLDFCAERGIVSSR
jgi:uncharacterized zinc-type alcohol dehydrogenase-like protein